jgi:hypothetical protein
LLRDFHRCDIDIGDLPVAPLIAFAVTIASFASPAAPSTLALATRRTG